MLNLRYFDGKPKPIKAIQKSVYLVVDQDVTFHEITLQGKIFWLKFAWNGIQTFIADVSVKQPFSRQFAITMRQIKINLKRKFGDSSGSHFIPETN